MGEMASQRCTLGKRRPVHALRESFLLSRKMFPSFTWAFSTSFKRESVSLLRKA
jgi:hypothetical protein